MGEQKISGLKNWVRGCESDCGENSNEPMYSLKEDEQNE
jgi:hypothetical protein